MTELTKTITFAVVGLLAVAIGILSRPSVAALDQASLVGSDLTRNFDAPEKAKRLRIVRVDEDTAERHEFEVAQQNGLWSIPSKDGYPADAAKQMADAATSLMGRKVLEVASENAGDHEQYGVVDPLGEKLEAGQKGIGTRVTMWNDANEALADLIIGKSVRDQEGQRYARKAGQDVVYVIEIDPAKLSTKFEDWIEKDLLKLSGFDLQQVQVKDYSAELVPVMTQDGRFTIQPTWDPRAEMTFTYNETDGKWSPVKLRAFERNKGEQGDYVDFTVGKDEELNEESLNGLKTALGDLKIVDVVRKPQGLSQDLKAGKDFANNREALKDLMSKGFTLAKKDEGSGEEILSSDGEAIATTKNGTQYVLRFGNLTNVGGGGPNKDQKAPPKDLKADAKDAKGDKGDKSDVHRYMFVMARFDESAVKQPELAKLPELPAGADAKANPATPPAKPADPAAAKAGDKPADAGAAAKKEDATKPKDGEAAAAKKEEPAKKDEPATKKDDPKAKKEDAAAKKDDAPAKKDDAAAKNPPAENKDVEKIIAERKRIEQENQHKLDEYQALIKKGKENVKDLNLRFGDWYFVVDDDVFRKIRLSRDKVVKKKEAPKAEGAAAPGAKPGGLPGAGIPGLPNIPGANK
jgi:hypothetical protein